MRIKTRNFSEAEDLTGLAGWLYTDLLLALMVIFLATISFVPQIYGTITSSSNLVNDNKPAYSYSQYYKNPLVKVYNNFDIDLIKKDIANFLVTEGLPTTSFIGSIQIVGGYDQNNEDSTQAIDKAVNFSNQIDKADPTILEKASTIISSSTSIGSNQVALRITFVADINVKN
ncbi:MAG: hypothetical protein ACO249_05890 [Candidatus Nanopelagicales bacterium]